MGGSSVRSRVVAGVFASVLTYGLAVHGLSAQVVATHTPPASATAGALVSVNVVGMELDRVLEVIAEQAGLKLFFPGKGVPQAVRVTLQLRNVPARDAFATALTGMGLQAVIKSGVVLLLDAGTTSASVIQGGISGRIVDSKTKLPVRGATVMLNDVSSRTTSGDDGRFRISNVAPGEYVLRIRMLGYVKTTKVVTVIEGQTASADIVLEPSVSTLDQVVVTGTVIPTERKAIPNAMTVITAKDLEQRGITKIDQLFRGDVPGIFALNQGSSTPVDQVIMFSRGASALVGRTNPIKTYVDGVELADPSYLSQIDPKSIERIEILTGPQASTIYGSNAINGVMQIFTKRGTTSTPHLTASLLSGLVQNNFSRAHTPQHDYSGRIDGIEGRWSYNVGGSWNYIGPWTPARQTARTGGSGGARIQIGAITADGSLLLAKTRNRSHGGTFQGLYGLSQEGVLASANYDARSGNDQVTDLNDQTLGLTVSYVPASWWSHEIVLGRDVSGLTTTKTHPAYNAQYTEDSLLSFAQNNTQRTSIRYSTAARIPVSTWAQLHVTLGTDTWNSLSTYLSAQPSTLTGTLLGNLFVSRMPAHNSGAFLQSQLSMGSALFLTYGLRAEWNPDYGKDAQPNIAPRYGVAYTHDLDTPLGSLTAKLRASYGRSTRPPARSLAIGSVARDASQIATFGRYYQVLPNPDLGPEFQQGGEGGIELYFGSRASLVVTRYNQTVDDLISSVTADSVARLDGNPDPYGYCVSFPSYCGTGAYASQRQNLNVGDIRNQGWELTGVLNVGPFTTRGTYSWTKSRTIGINTRYREQFAGIPEYQPGATFNWLPEHTWALGVTYTQSATSLALNLNGTGFLIREADELYYLNTRGRLTQTKPRIDLPRGYRAIGPGYTLADLNVTHRFWPRADGMLQIQNLTNFYQNDISSGFATLGRQTKAGFRIRL